ncbi:hypothetical protein BDR22DRAFT_891312 [Usnea florida]
MDDDARQLVCNYTSENQETTQNTVAFYVSLGQLVVSVESSASSSSTSPYMNPSSEYSPTPTISASIAATAAGAGSGASTTPKSTTSISGPSSGLPATTAGKPARKPNTAAVAGGIAGGMIGLALLLAVFAFCYRQRTTRALKRTDQGKLPPWGSAHARAIAADDRELEQIKPGPSPTASLLHPPSPWPLPPPPGYTPYRSHDNEPDRSPPNVSQASASSPHTFDTHPPPESPPPSPPPLNIRSSQDSADNNSEAPSVSPISSHYQRHPLDESEGLKSIMTPSWEENPFLDTVFNLSKAT